MREPSEKALEGLDEWQLQAVNALHGPVAILAGAGAGKTKTITHRIAHGVRTATYSPERVLALSFTKKAAAEVQDRLHSMGVQGVRTKTFHSAALQQLRFFWDQTVKTDRPKILNSKMRFLEHLLEARGLKKSPEALRDLAAEIEWRKTSMLTLKEYETVAEQRSQITGFDEQLTIDIMGSYEQLKRSRLVIDFEDVLLLMAGMLEEEARVAHTVRERYKFFTVDEYQDVSPVQHNLLKAWLGKRSDLCVVGDVSQTIYSFAGASSRYLLDFSREYTGAQIFKLEKNYRSTPEVISLANNLMHGRPGALTLQASKKSIGQVPICEWFANEKEEAYAVASAIKNKVDRGTEPGDIAVLYRSHGHSIQIEEALTQFGIGVNNIGGPSFFERAEIKRALVEIRASALAPDNKPAFQTVTDIVRGQGWSSAPPLGGANELQKWESLNALLSLLDELGPDTSLIEFSNELQRRSRVDHEPKLQAVTLSSVHAAKGLEWPVVWIIGASEGSFPISYAKTEPAIDEERRLFYVAITRAKNELYFSGAGKNAASRFLNESGLRVFN